MSDTPDAQNPLAPVALSGQSAPPPAQPPAGKKTLADIATELLAGGE